jgi:monofunctional biosynthetic peptidoglycan transglycosylase
LSPPRAGFLFYLRENTGMTRHELKWVLLAPLLCLLLLQGWFLSHVLWWAWGGAPQDTAFMRARLETLREKNPKAVLRHRWVDYERIGSPLKRAVIAAEDARFAEHEGFDWEGIERALEKNEKKGRAVAGGSTISQQLAKNLFLSGERSYFRKAQEAIITLMIEAVMSKRRILELYLNFAEWGDGVYGAEAAAQHYYGSSAASLDAGQAAWLAAILPRPRYYEKRRDTAYIRQRAARIETWLRDVTPP